MKGATFKKKLALFLMLICLAPWLLAKGLGWLDGYVEKVRKTWDVPGIAVAVVKDGKVLLAKGYGTRKKGENLPVTPYTLFGIASNTKAFTAAALAILVDEGKLNWDDPVIEHLPFFRMYDPYVTREITVTDLITHRSGLGLGAGDLLYWPRSDYSMDEIVRRVRFIKPRFSFRSRFAYCNILYIVAGKVVEAVSGRSWADFIKERILKPLGMIRSVTSIKEFPPDGDVASPHVPKDGKIVPVEHENLDNIGPAGGIYSCAADMAKWVKVQLARGLIESRGAQQLRLFSEKASQQMWSAHTIIPIKKYPPELKRAQPKFFAYGLGWILRDYMGYKIVYHTGSIRGMVSRVTLVPELNLAIVVLTNQEARGAYEAITYRLLDHFMGIKTIDWISAFKKAQQRRIKEAEETVRKLSLKRAKGTKPSLPLESYAGRYIDKWYGEMEIKKEGDKLIMRFCHTPTLVGELEHWHYNTFVVRWKDRSLNADAFVTFVLNYKGEIEAVKMVPVSPLTDFSFDFQDLLFVPIKKKREGK